MYGCLGVCHFRIVLCDCVEDRVVLVECVLQCAFLGYVVLDLGLLCWFG